MPTSTHVVQGSPVMTHVRIGPPPPMRASVAAMSPKPSGRNSAMSPATASGGASTSPVATSGTADRISPSSRSIRRFRTNVRAASPHASTVAAMMGPIRLKGFAKPVTTATTAAIAAPA
jgi:hypothetical protein